MTFADIAAAAPVFFDANIFVYHFEPHANYGTACTALVERVEHQELAGFTSAHVLSEVAHRLMALEAIKAFGWPEAGIAVRLRKHPAQVQTLQQFRAALQEIPRYGIQVIDTASAFIDMAAGISQQTGLLPVLLLFLFIWVSYGNLHIHLRRAILKHLKGIPESTGPTPKIDADPFDAVALRSWAKVRFALALMNVGLIIALAGFLALSILRPDAAPTGRRPVFHQNPSC